MIKTRIRKVLRDVRARLGRTALTSFAIFLGVAGTIALCSMSLVISEQLAEDIQQDELAMLDVAIQTSGNQELDDEAYLDAIREEFGEDLTELQAVGSFFTQFTNEADSDEFEDGGVFSFSEPLNEPLSLEPFRLVEGDYPAEGQNEVLIERRLADEYELELGDPIYLRILSPSRNPDLEGEVGTTETWTVSGIVFHPYMGASNGLQFQPSQAMYANLEDARYIGGAVGFSGYRARFETFELAEDLEKQFTAFVANNTPYSVPFSIAADPEQNQLITSAQTLTGTMSFLAVLALVVSGFLVVNVIGSIVTEQRQQIGIMKTLGASGGDNFLMFAGIALSYGVIGVIFGLPVGVILGHVLSNQIAPELNTFLEGFQWHPIGILIGASLGLLIPVLAAVIPVFFGVRVRILDAISDVGITSNYGTGPVAKLIGALPLPATIRQGFSNVSMKPFRTLFTVLTLAIAVGAFIGIFGVLSAIEEGFGSFLDIFNIELGVQPTSLGRSAEVIEVMDGNENIVRTEPAVFTLLNFVGYEPTASVGGPPGILGYGFDVTSEDPAFNFTIDEGEPLSAENAEHGVVMTSNLTNGLGADIGDTVTLDLPAGTTDVTIVGILEYPIDLMFADWRLLSKAAGFTDGGVVPNQYFTSVEVDGAAEPVMAIGASNQFTGFLTFTEGEAFNEEPTVIISPALADELEVGAGDTINLTATTADGTSGEYTVSGIVDTSAIPQGGAEQIPDNLIAMDYRNLAELEGISLDGEAVPQAYFARTTLSEPTVNEIDDVLEELEQEFLDRGIAVVKINFVEFQEMFTEAIRTIQFILQAVVLLIAAIGALGLLTTLSMSVFERQKEIGVMRSIGAGSSTVALQFLTEGLVVGFISWVVGLPIAALVQLGLLEVTQLRETFGFQFDYEGAALALVGVMIITTIASLWPSLSAARRTVSDILRYQ